MQSSVFGRSFPPLQSDSPGLVPILRQVLPYRALLGDPPTGSRAGQLGQTEIQETAQSSPTCQAMGRGGLPPLPAPVCTLGYDARGLLDGSRMTRECHVRFCERLGVRLPGATLPTRTGRVTPVRERRLKFVLTPQADEPHSEN